MRKITILSDKEIGEFQMIYKKYYGNEIGE